MRIVVFAFVALVTTGPTQAKDQFGRPELSVPGSAVKLQIAFSDATIWDGKRIPRAMQCARLGGQNPASPGLRVGNVPDATKSLVMYVVNVRAFDNHGLARITEGRDGSTWTIPPIRSLAQAEELPKGIELFDGGSQIGVAYSSPCPTANSWLYAITVYALGEKDVVLAAGEINMGYAP